MYNPEVECSSGTPRRLLSTHQSFEHVNISADSRDIGRSGAKPCGVPTIITLTDLNYCFGYFSV